MVNTFSDKGMSVWLWPSDYFSYAAIEGKGILYMVQFEKHTDVLIKIQGCLSYKAFTNYSYKPTIPLGLI